MILSMKDICKTYDNGKLKIPVLFDINLEVDNGEFLAIMGPSGSGKSTLLNIIGCLDTPTSGIYNLNGEDIASKDENALAEIRNKYIGFVFQSFNLLPRENALENVALPMLYAGIGKRQRLERAAAMLDKMGLGDRMDHLPGQLSGGQKQRVAIARAMALDPAVLLADEPTGALDSASSIQIMDIFKELNSEGTTIIMITHESEIADFAKRQLYIRDGRLYTTGKGDA